jgi:hypothetical protein
MRWRDGTAFAYDISAERVPYDRIIVYIQERFRAHAKSWPPMLPISPTAAPGDG